LLLSPKEILFDREKIKKEIRMQGSKLYVGNLSYSVTNEELGELFSNYGEVREVNIIEGKGFGFVEMSNPSEAEKAKEGLDGSDFEGRTLKIEEARPPRSRERGGGERRPYNRGRQRDEGRPPRDRQRRDSRRYQD
jgi:RNA recognition motif-containing protein